MRLAVHVPLRLIMLKGEKWGKPAKAPSSPSMPSMAAGEQGRRRVVQRGDGGRAVAAAAAGGNPRDATHRTGNRS